MASSTYDQISALIEGLRPAMSEEDVRKRTELIALIESDRHLLIGAKALIRYTQPRFTDDTDYAVGMRLFRCVRKWFKDHADSVAYDDEGEAIRSRSLAVDVLNAAHHPVLLEVLKAETGLPSLEGLAAFKYVAMVSPARGRSERIQDAADFSRLVLRADFDAEKLMAFMVGPFEAQRDDVRRLIDDLKAGRPIQV